MQKYSNQISIKKIKKLIENEKIYLSPNEPKPQENYDLEDGEKDIQRKNVWDNKRKQRLISSILNGYPIPSIILWNRYKIERDHRFSLSVIDGKQRLDAIYKFITNDLKFANPDKNMPTINQFFNDLINWKWKNLFKPKWTKATRKLWFRGWRERHSKKKCVR